MSKHTTNPQLESLLLPSREIEQMAELNTLRAESSLKLVPFEANRPAVSGVVYYVDTEGLKIDNMLHFHCRADFFNRLTFNRVAISARSLSYYFSGIQWRAGKGWPTYSERCPRSDTDPRTPIPNAPRHMLIVHFGGYNWTSCSNSSAGVGNQITDVLVGPNDEQMEDNVGHFDFIISGIGQ